jgi:hypothetical protein
MKPTDNRHRQLLKDDVVRARRHLEHHRKVRRTLVEDYAGDLWAEQSGQSTPHRVVVNLMQQAVSTYTMALAANQPRAKVTTDYRELLAFSRLYDVTLNNYLKTIALESVLRECVMEACFSMGIARVGLLPAGATEYGDPGRPGVEAVSFDDWFHDTRARCWERKRFCGHYYEADIEDLRNDKNYDQKAVAKLVPGRGRRGYDGAETSPVKELETQGELEEWDGYDGTVCLVDVWLPRERVLATFDAEFDVLLNAREWDGPDRGPYHLLRFDRVPDSIMGLPVAYSLKPLFSLLNNIWRKLERQARRQKSIGMYDAANEADARNLQRSNDGDFVKANNPDLIKTLTMGGVDGNLATFGIAVRDAFNIQSGNVEHMAGLGPSADTVGQERIIQGNVGQRLGKMSAETAGFTQGILEDLGFYLWRDEVLVVPGEIPIYDRESGVRESIPVEWFPKIRDGQYHQFNFTVTPHSMAYKSPAEQGATFERVLVQMIAPLLPYMQEQGIGVDWNATFETLAQLTDMPQIREVLTAQDPPSNEKPGPMPGKAPVTSRNYTRRNISTGGTRQGRNAAMAGAFSNTATPQQRAVVQSPG